MARAASHVHCLGEPFLIRPAERPIAPLPESREWLGGRDSARLPDVICTGRFQSLESARDPNEDYSSLVIVWFQDRFALPIDKPVLDVIQSLDWETLAVDWSW
jgi:hypothetical protein